MLEYNAFDIMYGKYPYHEQYGMTLEGILNSITH